MAAARDADAAPLTYIVTLSGGLVVPPPASLSAAGGFAQLVHESETDEVRFALFLFGVVAADVAGAELREGNPGTSGPLVATLAGAGWTQTSGRLTLTAAQASSLAAGRLYVEIRTVSQGGPALRGQLLLGAPGTQPPPPIPTVVPAAQAVQSQAQAQAPAGATSPPRILPPATGNGGIADVRP
jgi:hypothetical protein